MAIDTLSFDFGREKRMYVYIYRDPRKGKKNEPIYVGKGVSATHRADSHWEKGAANKFFARVLTKIRDAGLVPSIEILAWFDDNEDACDLEVALIARIGRRDKGLGPLLNLTDGGEGIVGLIQTPEHRLKNSLAKKAAWAVPEIYAAWIEKARPSLDLGRYDPVVRERSVATMLKTMAEIRADPVRSAVQGEQRSKLRTEAWANPTIRANYEASIPGANKIRRAKMSAHWDDPEYRALHEPNVVAAIIASWTDPIRGPDRKEAVGNGKRATAEEARVIGLNAWADPIKKAERIAKSNVTRAANPAIQLLAAQKAAERDAKKAEQAAKSAAKAERKAAAARERERTAPERRAAGKASRIRKLKTYYATAPQDVLDAHALNVSKAKKADGAAIGQRTRHYYDTASSEKLAEHSANISAGKSAKAEQIGKTSEEVWARPGMRKTISGRIKTGTTRAWNGPKGPERRKNQSASAKAQFQNPVSAKTHKDAVNAKWADPVRKAAILAKAAMTRAAKRAKKASELGGLMP